MDHQLEIFGTFGPDCHTTPLLAGMLKAGMNGMRINLSHTTLAGAAGWIESLHNACARTGLSCSLIMDVQGRSRRLGSFTPFEAEEGSLLILPDDLPISEELSGRLQPGDELVIGDGLVSLLVLSKKEGTWICEVLQGGLLEPARSIRIRGRDFALPVLSPADMENLQLAAQYGIDGVMVPFVQSAQDVQAVRDAMQIWLPQGRIFAKIENMEGVRNIDSIAAQADMVVIARGDLGAACSLTWLPAVQDYLEAACQKAGTPYMVVTQMLESMRTQPICTRAEAYGVYEAVLRGAGAIMLTGETARSRWPLEAMQTFCSLAAAGLKMREDPESIHTLIRTL